MAETADIEPAALPADADDEAGSLFTELRNLAEDAQTAAEAEIHFQSTRAGYVGGEAKGIALWLGLALVAAILALFALATGALLGLSPLVGPWLATAIVVGALLILAGLAAWLGTRGIARVRRNAFPAAKP